jgi:hypothetical protein
VTVRGGAHETVGRGKTRHLNKQAALEVAASGYVGKASVLIALNAWSHSDRLIEVGRAAVVGARQRSYNRNLGIHMALS